MRACTVGSERYRTAPEVSWQARNAPLASTALNQRVGPVSLGLQEVNIKGSAVAYFFPRVNIKSGVRGAWVGDFFQGGVTWASPMSSQCPPCGRSGPKLGFTNWAGRRVTRHSRNSGGGMFGQSLCSHG